MAMFLVFLAAQLVTGLYEYNATQREHGEPLVRMTGYLATGHPWEALFENWESEFLQMAVFVLLTTWLVQKGSPESRRPGVKELVDTDPRDFAHDPERPRGRSGEAAGSCASMSIRWGSHSFCCSCFHGSATRSVASRTMPPTKSCIISRSRRSPITSPRRVSGSSRFRTGRASSSPSRRWCGSPSTFDNDGRRNPNRCTHRMPKRDVEQPLLDPSSLSQTTFRPRLLFGRILCAWLASFWG